MKGKLLLATVTLIYLSLVPVGEAFAEDCSAPDRSLSNECSKNLGAWNMDHNAKLRTCIKQPNGMEKFKPSSRMRR
jgi:hypothetical protein